MKLKIEVEGKTYEVEVEVVEGAEGFFMPQQPGMFAPRSSTAAPAARKSGPAPAPAKKAAPTAAGPGAIVSPLAGNIWKVLVEKGQKVDPDETVIIIEAMKMETAIAASIAGTIKEVHVQPGDAVKVNQVLVEIEAD